MFYIYRFKVLGGIRETQAYLHFDSEDQVKTDTALEHLCVSVYVHVFDRHLSIRTHRCCSSGKLKSCLNKLQCNKVSAVK